MLRRITKPLPWRGRGRVIEDVFEHAQPLKRVEFSRCFGGWRFGAGVTTHESGRIAKVSKGKPAREWVLTASLPKLRWM